MNKSKSFSSEVKDELYKQIGQTRHCRVAELAVLMWYFATIEDTKDRKELVITTEHEGIARKCFTLLEKTFNIDVGILREERNYILKIRDTKVVTEILQAVKMWDSEKMTMDRRKCVSDILTGHSCCKRAFLRGVFLANGSISDPEKGYHLEFACQTEEFADSVIHVLADFDIEGKSILRKKYYVVYIKEGASVVEVLNVMGAHISLMNLENSRILKEIANDINRKVNCEAANLLKTVNAANSQIDDICFIRDEIGLASLSPQLQEMAEVRLEHPDVALKDLGAYLSPPIGKSGVNHRLRKLSEMADKLRRG